MIPFLLCILSKAHNKKKLFFLQKYFNKNLQFLRKYCYANYIHHHLVLNREIRPNSQINMPATTGQYSDLFETEN